MRGFRLPIPASPVLRSFGSFSLLAISFVIAQLVWRLNRVALAMAGQPAGDLAAVKTAGFALLLGVMAMLCVAWFSSLFEVQTAEAKARAARVLSERR